MSKRTFLVAVLDRVIGNLLVLPRRADLGVAIDAELHDEVGNHAEKAAVIVDVGALQSFAIIIIFFN